jgi:putative sterol carrier protein
MADATAVLFDELARRGHEPLLGQAVGSLRFEIVDEARTDVWLVTFDRGDVAVSREDLASDAVVRSQKGLFDAIAAGELNAMAAMLRGALTVEGDPELLVRFQRLLPAPEGRRGRGVAGTGSDRR